MPAAQSPALAVALAQQGAAVPVRFAGVRALEVVAEQLQEAYVEAVGPCVEVPLFVEAPLAYETCGDDAHYGGVVAAPAYDVPRVEDRPT